jgi:hypothetical protein
MALSSTEITRGVLADVQRSQEMVSAAVLDDAVQWFSRYETVTQIRNAMKARFGVGITKNSDGYETYSRLGMRAEIDAGLYEALDVGVGQRIVSALANLFSRDDSSWSYTTGSGDEDSDTEELINEHRSVGGAGQALVAADQIACAVESGFVRLLWEGGSLRYEPIAPQNVKVLYTPTVIDDGVERASNTTSLEDAAAIVVRLSGSVQSTSGTYDACRWTAYVGRSAEYPDGRCVTYTASANAWDQIPPPGSVGALDVVRAETGELCNPLSWLVSDGLHTGSEYPVVHLRGGHVSVCDVAVPTITALYETAVELTLAWSRLLKDALSGALGREVLANPNGAPLPEVTEGIIVLKSQQTFEVKTMQSGSITAAIDCLYAASGAVASGWNVPAYTVVSRIGAAPESGVALAIQAAPLMQFSAHRERLNKHSIDGMFSIERALINYHTGEDAIPWDTTASYEAGSLLVPQAEVDRVAAIVAAQDAGLTDAVGALREYHRLATDEAAQDMYDALKERHAANPKIGSTPTRPAVGLPPRAPRP